MKRANILIVDDEASSLKLLSRMLQSKGFHVRTLPNGELALKSIESHLPNILLLDIGLPGIDGFEVCRRVKQMKKGAIYRLFLSVPMMMLSILRRDTSQAQLTSSANHLVSSKYIKKSICI